MVKRYDAAEDIRKYLGPRLVLHEEWRSRVNYSAIRHPAEAECDQQVAHYHGKSAQLPRIARNALIYGDKEAECIQMRYVDWIHYVGNGWPHGFAYLFGGGPRTGLIYEARSQWYPHGAHFNDPGKSDAPIYFAFGANDEMLTEAQVDIWWTLKHMHNELFGMELTAVTDHGSIPGNDTSCAGVVIRQLVEDDKEEPTVEAVRVADRDRYTTNIVVDELREQGPLPGSVALVTGENFPDAVSAVGLGIPILSNPQAKLRGEVAARLISLNPSLVYVIGGEAALSASVLESVRRL